MLIVRSGGEQRILGVETKYTEPFTQEALRQAKLSGGHRPVGGLWFTEGAAEVAKEPRTNQLSPTPCSRKRQPRSWGARRSVVVLTAAHDHRAEQAVAGITPFSLEPDDTMTHTLLESVIAAAEKEPTLIDSATRFRARYLDLKLAEAHGWRILPANL